MLIIMQTVQVVYPLTSNNSQEASNKFTTLYWTKILTAKLIAANTTTAMVLYEAPKTVHRSRRKTSVQE